MSALDWILTIFAAALTAVSISFWISSKKKGNKRSNSDFFESPAFSVPRLMDAEIPDNLGASKGAPERLAKRLEESLPFDYMQQVKRRVLAHNPSWRNLDFEWFLFELKRYFLMCAVVKTVPMFSEGADEVWHEMIMFTREYQAFCQKFFGGMLHHEPSESKIFDPDARAWFDYVYSQLFSVAENSKIIYGGFLRHKLGKETLEAFEAKNDSKAAALFKNSGDSDAKEIAESVSRDLRARIKNASSLSSASRRYEQRKHSAVRSGFAASGPSSKRSDDGYSASETGSAMIFWSILGDDDSSSRSPYGSGGSGSSNNDSGNSPSSHSAASANHSCSSCSSGSSSSCSSSSCSSSSCGSSCGGGD